MKENKLMDFFNSVYSKAYLFIGVQVFALIILFFVLDKETGGSFLARVFAFLFCILVGGGLAVYWSRKNQGNPVISFRRGAGSFLTIVILLLWANNGYQPKYSGSSSTGGYPKACKAGCGYEITSSTYDCDGYHCTCVPGKNGESTYNKARRY